MRIWNKSLDWNKRTFTGQYGGYVGVVRQGGAGAHPIIHAGPKQFPI